MLPHQIGHDLRVGVGEGQDERLGAEFFQPFGLEHIGRGEAEKDIGAVQHLGQAAGIGGLGVARLIGVGARAALPDHAFHIADRHVFALEAHFQQQVEAGERGGAAAGIDQLHLG